MPAICSAPRSPFLPAAAHFQEYCAQSLHTNGDLMVVFKPALHLQKRSIGQLRLPQLRCQPARKATRPSRRPLGATGPKLRCHCLARPTVAHKEARRQRSKTAVSLRTGLTQLRAQIVRICLRHLVYQAIARATSLCQDLLQTVTFLPRNLDNGSGPPDRPLRNATLRRDGDW